MNVFLIMLSFISLGFLLLLIFIMSNMTYEKPDQSDATPDQVFILRKGTDRYKVHCLGRVIDGSHEGDIACVYPGIYTEKEDNIDDDLSNLTDLTMHDLCLRAGPGIFFPRPLLKARQGKTYKCPYCNYKAGPGRKKRVQDHRGDSTCSLLGSAMKKKETKSM